MSVQDIHTPTGKPSARKNALTAGIILIAIGLGLLFFRLTNLPEYSPLILGLVFLAAGIVTRKVGFLIPGGVLGGVGLGVLSTTQGWFGPENSPASGGAFLLAFSIGWFLITLLSKLFTNRTQTWALIPGGIMAAIGALIMMGDAGVQVLKVIGDYWPLILVVIGISILIGWYRERK